MHQGCFMHVNVNLQNETIITCKHHVIEDTCTNISSDKGEIIRCFVIIMLNHLWLRKQQKEYIVQLLWWKFSKTWMFKLKIVMSRMRNCSVWGISIVMVVNYRTKATKCPLFVHQLHVCIFRYINYGWELYLFLYFVTTDRYSMIVSYICICKNRMRTVLERDAICCQLKWGLKFGCHKVMFLLAP